MATPDLQPGNRVRVHGRAGTVRGGPIGNTVVSYLVQLDGDDHDTIVPMDEITEPPVFTS